MKNYFHRPTFEEKTGKFLFLKGGPDGSSHERVPASVPEKQKSPEKERQDVAAEVAAKSNEITEGLRQGADFRLAALEERVEGLPGNTPSQEVKDPAHWQFPTNAEEGWRMVTAQSLEELGGTNLSTFLDETEAAARRLGGLGRFSAEQFAV